MNDHTISGIVALLIAAVGLAVIAVLVSKNGNTTGVFSAGGGAIQKMICVALAPVTGGGKCGSLTENVTSTITFGNVPIPK